MKNTLFAAAAALSLATAATTATAAAQDYVLDASHSQIVFSYNHLGYSTTYGLFSGFEGNISFDQEDPAASSVSVSMPLSSMFTGWEARFNHFMGPDFFNAKGDEVVSFSSTAIEVTGDDTAKITGDLTLNGVTKPIVLDAKLNQTGTHPMAGKEWAGFDATATVIRSEFNLGQFAPFVSDEVELKISVEASKAE
ncbi:YceI family protein [Thalassobius sp. Cn5-15]|jgi:polyisoprenoid-binding protein YceI|uniref:YceI family protein n=1 Tax=Thalassobius sp. Cn5-15 TaxID=2917763 RepID=UPI001EF36B0B|nr:YceI family protein [Thalassobius sp. Cn5-15]MCG7492376.1 YceI family protein [Thalassobius sp. Cn5-15]